MKPSGVGIMVQSGSHVAVSTRLSGSRKYEGFDQFPGGAVDPGEDPKDAAVRELAEETGILRCRRSLYQIVPPITCSKPCGKLFVGCLYYVLISDRSEIWNPEPEKHTDWRWVHIEDIPTLRLVSWQIQYLNALRHNMPRLFP